MHPAPPVSTFDPDVSAASPQKTKFENGNSKVGPAQNAPGIANIHLRASADSPHLTSQRLHFLLRVTPPALESQLRHEVPACVTIAQAILESSTPQYGWGSSLLFRVANNPFGIKYCHRPLGPSDHRAIGGTEKPSADGPVTGSPDHPIPQDYGHFDAQTWEIENGQKKVMIAQFQRFPNLAEAFTAHAQLFRAPRYRPAFEVRHDWKQFAERLGPKSSPLDSEHCGYSTNPSYSAELIKLVELYRLNDPRALQWYATGVDPQQASAESRKRQAERSCRNADR